MMNYTLEILITASVLKSIFDLEKIYQKSNEISVLHELYKNVNEDIFMLACGNKGNTLADIINFVEENYLEKITGEITALLTPFGCGDEERYAYDPNSTLFSEVLCYPEGNAKDSKFELVSFLSRCRVICSSCAGKELLNRLLDVLEDECSFISLSGGRQSLFEITKLRAGIATCIWLVNQDRTESFDCNNDYILACSLDFLGIKDFKFQKNNSGNIKSEMLASLYVDLFRENTLDDLLESIGISRCNLIFSGGRHLHLFVPNTDKVKEIIVANIKKVNDWLVKMYKLDLYISYGMTPLHELCVYKKRNEDFYKKAFIRIANQKAIVEAKKYTYENIKYMNLGNVETLDFEALAEDFYNTETFLVKETAEEGLPIGPNRYITPLVGNNLEEKYIRAYIRKTEKNIISPKSISIWAQDITNVNIDFEIDKDQSYGILRFDIDDFKRFMLGIFSKSNITDSPTYKMELSKHFAIFLRRDFHLLIRKFSHAGKKIYCVHEGADDAFVFADIQSLALFTCELIEHYKRFTLDKMSFSAGISMYNCKQSFSENANLAQKLMDKAKTIPDKDGIAFLDENHVMKWEDFFRYARNCENMV